MGEEADADWQDGLVEWGIEDAQRWMDEKIMEAVRGGPPRKQRQTALRARGNGFETVELEPLRCTCGGMIVIHGPKCPFRCLTT
jgi:hypothetical protein